MKVNKKICSFCKKKKPLEDFYFDSAKNLYYSRCKKCELEVKYKRRHGLLPPNERNILLKEGKYRCSKCKQIKPLSGFYKSTKNKSGYDSYCKYCKSLDHSVYRKSEAYKKYQHEYYSKNKHKYIYNLSGVLTKAKLKCMIDFLHSYIEKTPSLEEYLKSKIDYACRFLNHVEKELK